MMFKLKIIFIIVVAFPLLGFGQEFKNVNMIEKEKLHYFGWENHVPKKLFPQKIDESFSIIKNNNIHQKTNLGFIAKQINSGIKFDYFSYMRDIQEIKLRRLLDPNRNYPNRARYSDDINCQPYPLIEVKLTNNFYIGI